MPLVAWATRVCLFATCPSSCRPCWTSCLIKVSSACLYYTYSTQLWKQTKIWHYSLCQWMWNIFFSSSVVFFAPQSQYSVVRSATLCTDHKSCAARMCFFFSSFSSIKALSQKVYWPQNRGRHNPWLALKLKKEGERGGRWGMNKMN